ncbi:MAG: peptidoglycan editing factor PgeF [Deltaproteobacteria bacterium]|nr:peptidoglycan editing factor PgeF [Deltaproteobacteria bacterium]
MPPEATQYEFPIFRTEILERDGVCHGFFGRPRPPLDGDRDAALRACAYHLGIPPEGLYILRQVHGDHVHILRKKEDVTAPCAPPCADIAITDKRGVYLCIRTADCVPILFFDPERRAVAAAHAGWRGTVLNVAGRAIRAMNELFGSRPRDICAALGPAVGPCCYEVDEPVAGPLLRADPEGRRFLHPARKGHWMLDLQALNVHQIVQAGVREKNVRQIPACTACRTDLFYSRRAEGGIRGEQISLIGLNP